MEIQAGLNLPRGERFQGQVLEVLCLLHEGEKGVEFSAFSRRENKELRFSAFFRREKNEKVFYCHREGDIASGTPPHQVFGFGVHPRAAAISFSFWLREKGVSSCCYYSSKQKVRYTTGKLAITGVVSGGQDFAANSGGHSGVYYDGTLPADLPA
ncbi:hypothetical protein M5K25_024853 [Dendrobium thyrsiflorum]|uniref:Uncharacterized protein n=1 Tax=Dendrobium thyrsiflorum TaxID=117978 RepID=A0ABD0U373_DENTH